MNNKKQIAFFGTSKFSAIVLETLKEGGVVPQLIITTEDKPAGRNLVLTPSPAKMWAIENKIHFFQPRKLKEEDFLKELKKNEWDIFVVASYGKIIPKEILDLPKNKTLNIHPSLLPKLRVASPIQASILTEEKVGVTIIVLDEEMDHGPIIAQKEILLKEWPIGVLDLKDILAKAGGKLLADIIPDWTSRKIKAVPQDHSQATYTKKIEKTDGLIDLTDKPEKNYRKILAYTPWPSAYFFVENKGRKTRVIIKEAKLLDNKLEIIKVLPEGKKEMPYADFMRGIK